MTIKTILTPLGEATLVGIDPNGTRVLCMHTRVEVVGEKKKSYTYAKWWMWNGTNITDEYDKENKL